MPISNQDLRKAGLKVTLPRIKILELLENSKQHHLSAEDIYKTLLGTHSLIYDIYTFSKNNHLIFPFTFLSYLT